LPAPPRLEESAVLRNQQNIRDACDFAVDDGGTMPWPPLQGDPRPLSAFLARIGEVRDGATVYVKTDMLDGFFALAFPRVAARIVLVTAGEDWSSPGAHARHLDDPRIIRWFGQNCDLEAPHVRFEPIPIGFTDSHRPHGNQAALLRVHRAMRPVTDRPLIGRTILNLARASCRGHHDGDVHATDTRLPGRAIPCRLLHPGSPLRRSCETMTLFTVGEPPPRAD